MPCMPWDGTERRMAPNRDIGPGGDYHNALGGHYLDTCEAELKAVVAETGGRLDYEVIPTHHINGGFADNGKVFAVERRGQNIQV